MKKERFFIKLLLGVKSIFWVLNVLISTLDSVVEVDLQARKRKRMEEREEPSRERKRKRKR